MSDYFTLDIPGRDGRRYWGRIVPIVVPQPKDKYYALLAERMSNAPFWPNDNETHLFVVVLASSVPFEEKQIFESPLEGGLEKIRCFHAILASDLFEPDVRDHHREFVEALFASQERMHTIQILPGNFQLRFELVRTTKSETSRAKTSFWNWKLEGQVSSLFPPGKRTEPCRGRASKDNFSAYC